MMTQAVRLAARSAPKESRVKVGLAREIRKRVAGKTI
jgi:hypothetical protein